MRMHKVTRFENRWTWNRQTHVRQQFDVGSLLRLISGIKPRRLELPT